MSNFTYFDELAEYSMNGDFGLVLGVLEHSVGEVGMWSVSSDQCYMCSMYSISSTGMCGLYGEIVQFVFLPYSVDLLSAVRNEHLNNHECY